MPFVAFFEDCNCCGQGTGTTPAFAYGCCITYPTHWNRPQTLYFRARYTLTTVDARSGSPITTVEERRCCVPLYFHTYTIDGVPGVIQGWQNTIDPTYYWTGDNITTTWPPNPLDPLPCFTHPESGNPIYIFIGMSCFNYTPNNPSAAHWVIGTSALDEIGARTGAGRPAFAVHENYSNDLSHPVQCTPFLFTPDMVSGYDPVLNPSSALGCYSPPFWWGPYNFDLNNDINYRVCIDDWEISETPCDPNNPDETTCSCEAGTGSGSGSGTGTTTPDTCCPGTVYPDTLYLTTYSGLVCGSGTGSGNRTFTLTRGCFLGNPCWESAVEDCDGHTIYWAVFCFSGTWHIRLVCDGALVFDLTGPYSGQSCDPFTLEFSSAGFSHSTCNPSDISGLVSEVAP